MDQPPKPGRAKTHVGDRGEFRRTPAAGSPIPEPVEDDDCTGKYDGDELKERRGRRATDVRIAHLEEKHDALVASQTATNDTVNKLATTVAGLAGEMKIIPELVSALRDAASGANERANVTLTAQVDVTKAQVMAPIEAQRTRYGWVTKLIAIVGTTVATVLAIIQARGC